MSANDNQVFLEPWVPVVEEYAGNLEQELYKELIPNHALYGCRVHPIAQRTDSDDVLFQLESTEHPYAVVHLTWTGEPEQDVHWPHAQLFNSWNEWVEKGMKPDHEQYIGSQENRPVQKLGRTKNSGDCN